MSVAVSDLRVPKGPLDSKLFPGLESRDLDARITGYIARATDDINVIAADPVVQDRMILALSLYYAFRDIVIRMSNEPARMEVAESGAHTYNAQQLDTMKEIRDGYLAQYNQLIIPIGQPVTSQLPGTRSGRTTQVW